MSQLIFYENITALLNLVFQIKAIFRIKLTQKVKYRGNGKLFWRKCSKNKALCECTCDKTIWVIYKPFGCRHFWLQVVTHTNWIPWPTRVTCSFSRHVMLWYTVVSRMVTFPDGFFPGKTFPGKTSWMVCLLFNCSWRWSLRIFKLI